MLKRLGILKKFDKTSQSYEIRKYCKNIGMQKLTFEEALFPWKFEKAYFVLIEKEGGGMKETLLENIHPWNLRQNVDGEKERERG